MRKRVRLFIIVAILIGLLASYVAVTFLAMPKSPESLSTRSSLRTQSNVDLLTSDGVTLSARYYPPTNPELAINTLLLLHRAYGDSRVWNDFRSAAQNAGYGVFTLDFRGHGLSQGEKAFDPTMDYDVDAALNWLITTGETNLNQIAILGESLGANLAFRAAARYPQIPKIILLSPGLQLWDISLKEAVATYGNQPLLLVSSEEDSYPNETVRQLDQHLQGPHELLLFPGADHGAEMLTANPDLTNQIFNWLQETGQ